jgi:hypothetical protein
LKSGSLNLLDPSGPVKGCNRIALPFTLLMFMPVPVAARSTAIVGSNPTGGMDVCLLCVCVCVVCHVEVSATS